MTRELSPLEEQAADALRRARRLPVGANRNDLRQLALGLLWLHRNGMDALVRRRNTVIPRALAPIEGDHPASGAGVDISD